MPKDILGKEVLKSKALFPFVNQINCTNVTSTSIVTK